MRKELKINIGTAFLTLLFILVIGKSTLLTPVYAAFTRPIGTNINYNGTIWFISPDNCRAAYTSAGAFLSYGFNSFTGVARASAADIALPVCSKTFIPPQDGNLVTSDRGSDKGTVYYISGGKKLGFTSAAVFTGLGYVFSQSTNGDVSWMPAGDNIDDGNSPHLPGALINNYGTIGLVGNNGLFGIPDLRTFRSWGYSLSHVVAANAADKNKLQSKVLTMRTVGQLSPDLGAANPTPVPTPSPAPSGWSKEKAEHLAGRALLAPTIEDINALTNAGSAANAFDIIFAPPTQAQKANYQAGLNALMQKSNSFPDAGQYQNVLYTYKLINDPDRARRKLFYLWENIFSVDLSDNDKQIIIADIIKMHDGIYANAYGSYSDLLEGARKSYALTKFLDLEDSKGDNPNENFSRELLQLFSMGENAPGSGLSNYSSEDVNALAYILSGYVVTPDRNVTLNQNDHFQDKKVFLGDMFNDPERLVPYLFLKRSASISEFLADKLLRYYVTDAPSTTEILQVASIIRNNNFLILPSLKQLLTSDIFQAHIDELRYKNPLEIIAGTYQILYGNNSQNLIPQPADLDELNFIPYYPGSVFGRYGFSNNANFLTGSILNRWIATLQKFTTREDNNFKAQRMAYLLNGISDSATPDDLLRQFENKFYLGRSMSENTRQIFKNYLTISATGDPLNFSPTDPDYQTDRIQGLTGLLLTQPEFLVQSGHLQDQAEIGTPAITKTRSTYPRLILVKLDGGLDYMQLAANIKDPSYYTFRQDLALDSTNSFPLLGDYVINNFAASLKPLIQKKQAFFVNSVGLPNHSRGHDTASEQMDTGLARTSGIITKQFANSIADLDLISMTSTAPTMFRGSSSLQFGSADLRLYDRSQTDQPEIANWDKAFRDTVSKNILNKYVIKVYSQALLLDQISNDILTKKANPSPGNFNNKHQFNYISELLQSDIGKAYFLFADGSYDSHSTQKQAINDQIKQIFDDATTFFNQASKSYPITMVFYSEFGRTNRENGSKGTDHGEGGGMVIVSNVLKWPKMTGSLNPSQDQEDWLTVQIDARDVWSTIFRDLYKTPVTKLFGRDKTIFDYPQP